MTAKQLRTPKLKNGELRMYWGRTSSRECAEIMYAWQGDTAMKADSRLLYGAFGSERPDLFVTPLFSKMKPNLLDELEARGYDLTTLKFSIQKKVQA